MINGNRGRCHFTTFPIKMKSGIPSIYNTADLELGTIQINLWHCKELLISVLRLTNSMPQMGKVNGLQIRKHSLKLLA